MHILQKIIEASGRCVRDYTGRGMYNKKCVGVVCSSLGEFLSDIYSTGLREYGYGNVTDNLACELAEALSSIKTDSMGRDDIIVYFPDVSYTEEDFDDSEDDSEE
jgi:hypothetical protein